MNHAKTRDLVCTGLDYIKGDRILRQAEARQKCGNPSRPTWYKWIKQGLIPRPLKFQNNFVGWKESELDAVLERLTLARDRK